MEKALKIILPVFLIIGLGMGLYQIRNVGKSSSAIPPTIAKPEKKPHQLEDFLDSLPKDEKDFVSSAFHDPDRLESISEEANDPIIAATILTEERPEKEVEVIDEAPAIPAPVSRASKKNSPGRKLMLKAKRDFAGLKKESVLRMDSARNRKLVNTMIAKRRARLAKKHAAEKEDTAASAL